MGNQYSTGNNPPPVQTADTRWFNAAFGLPTDNYKNPISSDGIPAFSTKGTCNCLNPDGTINKQAFQYNNKCYKCTSKRDTFYGRGVTTANTWGAAQANQILQGQTTMGQVQYGTLDDAKATCESVPDCKGVIQGFDPASGSSIYTLTSGTTLQPLQDSTVWQLTRGNTVPTVQFGNYTGKTFSASSIPRAFADDYNFSGMAPSPSVQPNGPDTTQSMGSSYTNSQNGAATGWMTNLSTYFANALMLSSAEDTIIQALEQPNTYYRLIGTERRLLGNGASTAPFTPADTGICVGPCDPLHPLHDPVQLLYDPYYAQPAGSNPAQGLYILYGTTCHDSAETQIDKPKIPAKYIPQEGNKCPSGENQSVFAETTGAGGSKYCQGECPYGSTDNGTSCSTASTKRSSIVPTFSCPPGLTLVDASCMYPCDAGFVLSGEYCIPNQYSSIVPLDPSIKCTSKPYLNMQDGSSTVQTKKWLCDSQADLTALLTGPVGPGITPGTQLYVGQSDIVCLADDPTTGMYYCQSITEAQNSVGDTERDDLSSTCDNLAKAYYDLSNNLSVLLKSNNAARNSNMQVVNIQATLKGAVDTMCPPSAGSSPNCTSLRAKLADLQQSNANGGSAVTNIQNTINMADMSRSQLIAQLGKFQCSY